MPSTKSCNTPIFSVKNPIIEDGILFRTLGQLTLQPITLLFLTSPLSFLIYPLKQLLFLLLTYAVPFSTSSWSLSFCFYMEQSTIHLHSPTPGTYQKPYFSQILHVDLKDFDYPGKSVLLQYINNFMSPPHPKGLSH